MKFDDIIRLQYLISDWLDKKNIPAFSVYITLVIPKYNQGLCSISFYNVEQLHEFLNVIEYSVQCNKSDYIILEETSTILITGLALIKLYSNLV